MLVCGGNFSSLLLSFQENCCFSLVCLFYVFIILFFLWLLCFVLIFALPAVVVLLACSLAFNQALWIYTSELYPAEVRSSGLGLTTIFARIGGGAAPWLCSWMYWRSKYMAVGACVAAALLAAMVASKMPKDTKGSKLEVNIKEATTVADATAEESFVASNDTSNSKSRNRSVKIATVLRTTAPTNASKPTSGI